MYKCLDCGWRGDCPDSLEDMNICPECGSTGIDQVVHIKSTKTKSNMEIKELKEKIINALKNGKYVFMEYPFPQGNGEIYKVNYDPEDSSFFVTTPKDQIPIPFESLSHERFYIANIEEDFTIGN